MTNFRLFQTEQFEDYNFKFDKNGKKLSKMEENILGTGEIVSFNENRRNFFKMVENTVKTEKLLITSSFFFSHSVFKRLILQTCKNKGLFGKELRRFLGLICQF